MHGNSDRYSFITETKETVSLAQALGEGRWALADLVVTLLLPSMNEREGRGKGKRKRVIV